MKTEILSRLRNAGLLSDQELDLGQVPTGSYALNKIISGDYFGGIPIGMISQFIGESSTAKTVFVTHILKEAQEKGYYTVLVDSENAFNSKFATSLGLDPTNLIYASPETLEDCFQIIEDTILSIREVDSDTPIVVGYDSIAVSPSKSEYEAESYDGNNMQGAVRAKATGACLRKINPLLRKHKAALIIVNQIRNKIGVMFGNPETAAGGGKALEYYLGVNLKCRSNKTSDLIKDENKETIGICGTIKNTKNKISRPYRSCDFELLYDQGLTEAYGLVEMLVKDDLVIQNAAWYTIKGTETKFQKKTFISSLYNDTSDDWQTLRNLLKITCNKSPN